MVRFPTLKLGESVTSKMLVAGQTTTAFLLSKYSARSVIPKALVGSTLKYKAEPHQLLLDPESGFYHLYSTIITYTEFAGNGCCNNQIKLSCANEPP